MTRASTKPTRTLFSPSAEVADRPGGGYVHVQDRFGVDDEPFDRLRRAVDESAHLVGEAVGVGVEEIGAEAVDDEPGLGLHRPGAAGSDATAAPRPEPAPSRAAGSCGGRGGRARAAIASRMPCSTPIAGTAAAVKKASKNSPRLSRTMSRQALDTSTMPTAMVKTMLASTQRGRYCSGPVSEQKHDGDDRGEDELSDLAPRARAAPPSRSGSGCR